MTFAQKHVTVAAQFAVEADTVAGKTVLLVEDNASDIELTQRAFAKNNVDAKLVVVEDGQEAIDYLYAQGKYAGRNAADMPVLILLDINLPRLSGLEVLKQIRSQASSAIVPVVMLTSSKEHSDVSTSYRYGVNAYIRKPVDFQEFSEVVRVISIFWLKFNELPSLLNGGALQS